MYSPQHNYTSRTSPSPQPSALPWGHFPFPPSQVQDTDIYRDYGVLPGVKEVLMVRQVHALEHATVWVLSELFPQQFQARGGPQIGWPYYRSIPPDNGKLSGLSTERGFYLYGMTNTARLRRAVNTAQQRLISGEWGLAIHPRCGTNLSVAALLTTGLVVGMGSLLPKGPIEQCIGVGLATTIAAALTPHVGPIVQQYVTTAIPFNLVVDEISLVRDRTHPPGHFVHVHWVDAA